MQNDRDVKLQADIESEKLIRDELGKATGLPIVGEEGGGDEGLPDSDQLYWCVDPLDGTFNYLRNIPICCVSIGLLQGKKGLLGAIYDFNNNELFSACADGELLINSEAFKPEWARDKSQACLESGFPGYMDYSDENLNEYIRKIQCYKKVRMLGSAAITLDWVACGRLDVYYEETIRLWDIAGGLAMLEAVGAPCKILPSDSGESFAYDIWTAGKAEFSVSTSS